MSENIFLTSLVLFIVIFMVIRIFNDAITSYYIKGILVFGWIGSGVALVVSAVFMIWE